jgi:hypothetical protein
MLAVPLAYSDIYIVGSISWRFVGLALSPSLFGRSIVYTISLRFVGHAHVNRRCPCGPPIAHADR